MIKTPDGLANIAENYDALLCDAWGVLHNGVSLFDGVADALLQFRQRRGPVLILTNAPRLGDIIPPQLDRLGLPRAAYDGVVTSGDATRAAILQMVGDKAQRSAFRLGPDKDNTLYDGLALVFKPLDQADFIICTGLFDDQTETPDDYRDLLTKARARNLPMICANPDIVVRWGDRMIYCGGALAALYEELGGSVTYAGKPHKPIYDLALARLRAIKPDLQSHKILVIGDGLGTDILGANQQNLDVIFIADGIASEAVNDSEGEDGFAAPTIERFLQNHHVHAMAAMKGLKW